MLIGSQTYMHAPTTLPYILIATGLFVFDRLARLFRTRYTKAWLTGEHALNGGTTLVHVPSLGAGWRAGQHVRLRVVSSAWFGWLTAWLFGRARAFTIAAGSDSGGMILSIKAQGPWSRKLLRKSAEAAGARSKERYADPERGRGPSREVPIIIDGPYGRY
jgi:ferric-chelate reductase